MDKNIKSWSKLELKIKFMELLSEYNQLKEDYQGAKEIINNHDIILNELNNEIKRLKNV